MALIWRLFGWAALAEPDPLVVARHVTAQLWPMFTRSALDHEDTVVAATRVACVALASVRSFSLRVSELLRWRARQLTELLCPQFAWSSCAQPATVVAGTTVEVAYLASDRLAGVGSASQSGSRDDKLRSCCGLCSLGCRGFSQRLW